VALLTVATAGATGAVGAEDVGAAVGAAGAACPHAARMATLAPPANRRSAPRRLRLELLDPVIKLTPWRRNPFRACRVLQSVVPPRTPRQSYMIRHGRGE
jgi:hypothetical protein